MERWRPSEGADRRGAFARRERRDYALEREIVAAAPRVIGVKQARAELARLLRDVLAGRDWLITDYGRPVAKLVSVIAGDLPLERRIRQLEEAGVIERPPPDAEIPVPIVLHGRRVERAGGRRLERSGGRLADPPAEGARVVYYWDGPAIFSTLFRDRNTDAALALLRSPAIHLASTLAQQQVFALTARLRRQGRLSRRAEIAAAWALSAAPFRTTRASPSWIGPSSKEWALGAIELWHLAAAQALARPLPELRLLSFDLRLRAAAESMRLRTAGERKRF